MLWKAAAAAAPTTTTTTTNTLCLSWSYPGPEKFNQCPPNTTIKLSWIPSSLGTKRHNISTVGWVWATVRLCYTSQFQSCYYVGYCPISNLQAITHNCMLCHLSHLFHIVPKYRLSQAVLFTCQYSSNYRSILRKEF
jgi:hypothetical protein